jgi:hypothetical protein
VKKLHKKQKNPENVDQCHTKKIQQSNILQLHCTYMLYHSMISFMVHTNWNIHQLLVEHLFSGNIFQLQMSTAPRALMCACTHQRLLWNLDHRNTQKKQNKANNTTITTGLRPRCAKFLFNLLIVLFSPACALATVASCIPSPSITLQSHCSLPLPAKDQPLRVKCHQI